tara:strand:- start:125 stop:1153 length:1029 start_codon:yes stop_codon:yes gene_type:complete
MNKIIKWGLIGLGNASLNLANEFNKIDNSKLIAIASKTDSKLEEFKKKFHIANENAYSDYENIFKNNDIDIIFIGLPNNLHERFCLKALEYNKHVLVEKPITINYESFLKIKKEFNKKNLLLEEGTANKHHPFYKNVIDILSKINHSNIYKIKTSFGNDALGGKKIFGFRLKKINTDKRLFNRSLGGGAILDGGIYPISILVDILDLFSEDYLQNFNIYKSSKKISNNIDLNSKIYGKTKKIEIEIETSLIKNLSNNVEIYTNSEIIKIENIFNISSNSVIQIQKDDDTHLISNIDKNNSYYHEIKEISELLIENIVNHKNFQREFIKIEKNFRFLSKWLLA